MVVVIERIEVDGYWKIRWMYETNLPLANCSFQFAEQTLDHFLANSDSCYYEMFSGSSENMSTLLKSYSPFVVLAVFPASFQPAVFSYQFSFGRF